MYQARRSPNHRVACSISRGTRPWPASYHDSVTSAPACLSSVASLLVKDRFESVVTVVKTTDGWSYEIVKEGAR